jgi:hypothetical protein
VKKVVIYVDTNKDVGDVNHLQVFADEDAAETWFAKNDPEGAGFVYPVQGASQRDHDHGRAIKAINDIAIAVSEYFEAGPAGDPKETLDRIIDVSQDGDLEAAVDRLEAKP